MKGLNFILPTLGRFTQSEWLVYPPPRPSRHPPPHPWRNPHLHRPPQRRRPLRLPTQKPLRRHGHPSPSICRRRIQTPFASSRNGSGPSPSSPSPPKSPSIDTSSPPPATRHRRIRRPPPPKPSPVFSPLAKPPPLSRLIAMRLQAFDNQPGVSIPFEQLDYDALGRWPRHRRPMDERAEYPHFLMSKVYSSVTDETRKRKARGMGLATIPSVVPTTVGNGWRTPPTKPTMSSKTPSSPWKWRTTFVGKPPPAESPEWVRQIEVLFAENQNQYEVAAAILSNQLEARRNRRPTRIRILHHPFRVTRRKNGRKRRNHQRSAMARKNRKPQHPSPSFPWTVAKTAQ